MHTSTIFFESCRLSLTQVFGFQEQRVKPMGDDLLTEKGPNRYHDPQVTQQWSSPLHMYMCTYLIVQLYLYVVFGIIRYSKFSFLYCISAISIIYHINVCNENGYMKISIFECDFNWTCSNMKNRIMQFFYLFYLYSGFINIR